MSEISFIITTYNYANYIQECVNSIINQDNYQEDEIIIIDDYKIQIKEATSSKIEKIIISKNIKEE